MTDRTLFLQDIATKSAAYVIMTIKFLFIEKYDKIININIIEVLNYVVSLT